MIKVSNRVEYAHKIFPTYNIETSSPVRKRRRMSSPTYDSDYVDLSQDDLDALDKIEQNASQNKSPRIKSSDRIIRSPRALAQVARQKRQREIETALRGAATTDKENIHEEPAKMAFSSPEVPFSLLTRHDFQQDNPFSVSHIPRVCTLVFTT